MASDTKFTSEVVVVGGGPAGAATAFTLGKLGVETIVIDRKSRDKIGDKVCGDALAPEFTKQANDWVGLPRPKQENGELQEYCEKAVLVGMKDSNFINLSAGSATVDRLLYGQALINAVDEYEHTKIIPETKLMDVVVENDTVKGIIGYNQEYGKFRIDCKVVVDASGSSGVVRKRLPKEMCTKFPQKIPRHQMIVAYREIIRVPEPHDYQNGLYLTYEPEMHDMMPGYYWIFSRGEKEMNIGLGWMIYDRNRGANIRDVNEAIRERKFPDAEVLRSEGDQIPARLPLPSLVHNGFITVGDAGALANPLNGEGHGPALLSGIKAAEKIAEAIDIGDVSERALWDYNKWIWHKYGLEFSWGIAIVKWVNKFGIEKFDWLMEKGILHQDDILTMINDPDGEINIVKRALRGWYRPFVLWGLKKALDHAKEIQQHARNYPEVDEFDEWLTQLKEYENKKI